MALLREIKQALGLDTGVETSDDIRGWSVVDQAGTQVGRVDDLMYDPQSHEVRYAIVSIDGRRVLLPIGELGYDESNRQVTARGYNRERLLGLRDYDSSKWNEVEERETYRGFNSQLTPDQPLDYRTGSFRGEIPKRIQLLEERLRIGKVREKTGEVTLGKRPVEQTVQEQVSLAEDKIDIQRNRVDRPVQGGERISMEAETVSVPLYAERAEVNKETFVREEVEVNKHTEERVETVNDSVRHEELVTEGLEKPRRELSFAGTEPTIEEIAERERLEQPDVTNTRNQGLRREDI